MVALDNPWSHVSNGLSVADRFSKWPYWRPRPRRTVTSVASKWPRRSSVDMFLWFSGLKLPSFELVRDRGGHPSFCPSDHSIMSHWLRVFDRSKNGLKVLWNVVKTISGMPLATWTRLHVEPSSYRDPLDASTNFFCLPDFLTSSPNTNIESIIIAPNIMNSSRTWLSFTDSSSWVDDRVHSVVQFWCCPTSLVILE